MSERWTNLLGLAKKAGKVAPGENQASLAMKREEARLLVLAEDAGPSLYRKYHLWAQDLGVPVVRIGSKAELGHAIGMGPHAVLAILDEKFGARILEEMRKSSGGISFDRKRQGQSQSLRTGQGTQTGQSATHRSAAPTQGRKHQKPHEHRGAGGREDSARHHGGEAAARTQAGAETRTGAAQRASDGASRPAAAREPRKSAPRRRPDDPRRSE